MMQVDVQSRQKTISTNCISYWYPKLKACGVPTPRTYMVRTDLDFVSMLDGNRPKNATRFFDQLRDYAEDLGWPVFMRTGQGSGKHDWCNTCFVRKAKDIPQHVMALVEWSHCADPLGLPTNVWAMRELLAVSNPIVAKNSLPIGRERRYFIRDGKVVEHFPYWPEIAVERLNPKPVRAWKKMLYELNVEGPEEVKQLTDLTQKVADVMPGHWSVDWMYTTQGWVCIDMALGDSSWHP